MVVCWSVCCNMGGEPTVQTWTLTALLDSDCLDKGRSHRVTEWTRVRAPSPIRCQFFNSLLKFLSWRTCALGVTSVSSPHGFGFCLKQKKKWALSLSLTLCLPLSLTLILSLKLGSCWASEKGGDFLLDKHVINLREHILSHRKITKGEMSGVVTQATEQSLPLHVQHTDRDSTDLSWL